MRTRIIHRLIICLLSFPAGTLIQVFGGCCPVRGAHPLIDSLIGQINTTSYAAHFDSLRTHPGATRKVEEANRQSADHDACRDYIYHRFQTLFGNENCYQHSFDVLRYRGLTNVVAYKKGRSPWKGILVVGAHYDTNNNLDRGDAVCDAAPGANDNGTGLAALLEIARILAPIETEKSILFAAWDFEEQFIYGYPTGSNEWFCSFVRNRKPTNWQDIGQAGIINRDDLSLNINFDMFGRPGDSIEGIPVLWACAGNAKHGSFVEQYALTLNRYLTEALAVYAGKMPYSDHYTFANRNIPAVENLESNYRDNPFYHTCNDHKLQAGNVSWEFATDVTRAGLAYILEEAGVAKPGRNQKPTRPMLLQIAEHPDYYLVQPREGWELAGMYSIKGEPVRFQKQKSFASFGLRKDGPVVFQIRKGREMIFEVRLLNKKDSLPALTEPDPRK
ncbi:MAG TPA: M28 family peptidase [Prolixibacteraceae bacterium]|nr:M28 family peptidase [Prolixibacteraceae bacterium]